MTDETNSDPREAVSEWTRETYDKAVQEIMSLGVLADELVEARPIWTLPYRMIIGQARESNVHATFTWIICGDVPTDHISSTVASTPRDAARYFSLKWQLDATRCNEPAQAETLAAKAEEVYEIVEDEDLWPDSGNL